MASLRELIVKISADSSDFQRGIAAAQKQAVAMSSKFEAAGAVLTRSLTLPLGALGALSLRSAAQFDSLERGLRAVSKSAGDAEAQMARLRKVAELPGLGFREAVQGSINLQAAGLSAGTAERALRAFGNALATVGKGRAELDGVVLALSQIQSKGKISAEEINQLAERLPQIRVAIRDAFGTADTEAIQKLGVTSEQFIEKVIQQFEKLPPVTGGLANSFENLRDRAEQSLAKIGGALAPAANAALTALEPIIDAAGRAAEAFAKLPQPAQTAAIALLAVGASAGPILTVVSNLGQLQTVLLSITNLLRNPVVLPFVLAAGAIAATAKQLQDLEKRYKDLESQVTKSTPAVKSFAEIDFSSGFRNSSTLDELKVKAAQNSAAFRDAGAALGDFGAKVDRSALAAGLLAKNTSAATAEAKKLAAVPEPPRFTFAKQIGDAATKQAEADVIAFSTAAFNADAQLKMLSRTVAVDLNPVIDTLGIKLKGTFRDPISDLLKLNAALVTTQAQIDQVNQTLLASTRSPIRNLPVPGTVQTDAALKTAGIVPYDQLRAQAQKAGDLYEQVNKEVQAGTRSAEDAKKAYEAWTEAEQKAAGITTKTAKESEGAWKRLGRQVSTIKTDFSRAIADLAFQGGKVGEIFKNIGIEIGKSLTRFAIEEGIDLVIKSLGKLLVKVVDVGGVFAKVFGTASDKVGKAAGQLGSAAASGGGGGEEALAGGQSGGGILGILANVSSVLQYLQGRRMEQDIGRIEVTSRGILNDLANLRRDEWDRFNQEFTRQGELLNSVRSIYDGLSAIDFSGLRAGGAGGGVIINNAVFQVQGRNGEELLRDVARQLKLVSAGFNAA